MAIRDATTARLCWHAGIGGPAVVDGTSVASCTWHPKQISSQLDTAVQDFTRTLATLNHELNGSVPSRGGEREDAVPRNLTYAVTEVLRMIRELGRRTVPVGERERIERAAWRAETAWSAVLAGDIDSIEEHLALEEAARFG